MATKAKILKHLDYTETADGAELVFLDWLATAADGFLGEPLARSLVLAKEWKDLYDVVKTAAKRDDLPFGNPTTGKMFDLREWSQRQLARRLDRDNLRHVVEAVVAEFGSHELNYLRETAARLILLVQGIADFVREQRVLVDELGPSERRRTALACDLL